MTGKVRNEESRKEMRKRPGAPRGPATATIFCFQPLSCVAIICGVGETLLSESRAGKMVHEDLHKRGAMEIWQLGNFSDDAHMPELLDALAIFAILVTDEHDAVNRKLGGVERGKSQQGVIDGAHTAARRKNHGQLELHHHI